MHRRWAGKCLMAIGMLAALLSGGALGQVAGLMAATSESAPAPNTGAIEMATDLNHLNVVISPSNGASGGCTGGQLWDIGAGRCTSAVALRSENTSRSCTCSCPAGYSGTCRGSQSGTYSVFGWRTPPNGAEVISHNGATSWGTCRETSNTCTAPADPPSGGGSGGGGSTPTPGATFPIDSSFTSMICGPGDKGWTSVTINDQYKTQLVNYYKGMGTAGRCPDEGGFKYWLDEWKSKGQQRASETFKAAGSSAGGADWSEHLAQGYSWAWSKQMKPAIDASAAGNNEAGAGGIAAGNSECQKTANKIYGINKVKASYIPKSGNRCRIDQVL